jgi:hypothetical protein
MPSLNINQPVLIVVALLVALLADPSCGVRIVERLLLSGTKFGDAAAITSGGPSIAASATESYSGMSASFEAEYPAYSAGSSISAYSLLSIACPEWFASGVDRPPLILSVVMDKSGSMSGDKIHLLKKTTEFLVSRLTDKDKLGIVAYDDQVRVG